MITTPLRILLVEASETDLEIIKEHVKMVVVSPQFSTVNNLEEFGLKLQTFVPDVVISDYNLPTCTGLDILEFTRSKDQNLPFLFLTGAIEDEELAANTILAGATGFILKKHMPVLAEKLRPLLKRIVFNMDHRAELREKIRRNRIALNQIYDYLDNVKSDNEEQLQNIKKIKKDIKNIKFDDEM